MNPKGTEIILSDENKSLKEKIKSLQEEVHRLEMENDILHQQCKLYLMQLDSIKSAISVIDYIRQK